MPTDILSTAASLEIQDNTLYCQGNWTLQGITELDHTLSQLPHLATEHVILDGSQVAQMDTAGAWLLRRTYHQLAQHHPQLTLQNFSDAQQHLFNLTTQYCQNLKITPAPPPPSLLQNIGISSVDLLEQAADFLAFVGETFIVLLRLIIMPTRIRWQAIAANLYATGVTAMPIIGLMAFLIGLVLAYQGGEQLKLYGANILIVDLVGITLLRELAPLLTAIIVAGRSGSAFTAQIGTMRVTDEIDALQTIGISPMELLVLPKLIALLIALPLLSAYADVMGVLGGMLIASLTLDVNVYDFLDRFPKAVYATHYVIGIGKAPVFAAIITAVGCYQGFKVQGGADSVGQHVTISVVQSIFLVIVADAVFSIIFSWLGV